MFHVSNTQLILHKYISYQQSSSGSDKALKTLERVWTEQSVSLHRAQIGRRSFKIKAWPKLTVAKCRDTGNYTEIFNDVSGSDCSELNSHIKQEETLIRWQLQNHPSRFDWLGIIMKVKEWELKDIFKEPRGTKPFLCVMYVWIKRGRAT